MKRKTIILSTLAGLLISTPVIASETKNLIPENNINTINISNEEMNANEIKESSQISTVDFKVFNDDKKMVPLRKTLEPLGYKLKWNDASKEVSIIKGALEAKVKINDSKYSVNTNIELLDEKAIIINELTYVPLEFISKVLGHNYKIKENSIDFYNKDELIENNNSNETTDSGLNDGKELINNENNPKNVKKTNATEKSNITKINDSTIVDNNDNDEVISKLKISTDETVSQQLNNDNLKVIDIRKNRNSNLNNYNITHKKINASRINRNNNNAKYNTIK